MSIEYRTAGNIVRDALKAAGYTYCRRYSDERVEVNSTTFGATGSFTRRRVKFYGLRINTARKSLEEVNNELAVPGLKAKLIVNKRTNVRSVVVEKV